MALRNVPARAWPPGPILVLGVRLVLTVASLPVFAVAVFGHNQPVLLVALGLLADAAWNDYGQLRRWRQALPRMPKSPNETSQARVRPVERAGSPHE